MLLTDLAELIADNLNEYNSSWKPTDFATKAIPCLDWVTFMGQVGFKVLVVPELIQYNVDGQRRVVRTYEANLFISVLVGYTFEGTVIGTQDVAPWSEVKKIIDTRQHIEHHILGHDYSPQKVAVAEIESQPVEELELGRRNFSAVTSYAFEDLSCVSSDELDSMQTISSLDTESPETRASIRRAALSARRLGRRYE